MANKKVSELTEATSVNSADVMPVAQSGASKKVTMSNLISSLLQLVSGSVKGLTSVNDSNSNEVLKFASSANAVNEITITNNATGVAPTITATGNDTNIDVSISGKGTGAVKLSGNAYPTASATAGQIPVATATNTISFAVHEKSGITNYAESTSSGNKTIAHGLGRTPSKVVMHAQMGTNHSSGGITNYLTSSSGYYDGTNQGCVYSVWTGATSGIYNGGSSLNSTTKVGTYIKGTSTSPSLETFTVVSVDSTNITINLPSSVGVSQSAASGLSIFWTVM